MADEKKTTGETMSAELAEQEIARWAEDNDIDIVGAGFSDTDKLSLTMTKERLVKSMQRGFLSINDKGNFVYTVSQKSPAGFAGTSVEIVPPNGRAYMGIDNYKTQQMNHKIVAICSAMTGKDIGWFSNLYNTDYKVFTGIAQLFMSA